MTRKRKTAQQQQQQQQEDDSVGGATSSKRQLNEVVCDFDFMRRFEQTYGYVTNNETTPQRNGKRNRRHKKQTNSNAQQLGESVEQAGELNKKVPDIKPEYPSDIIAFMENLLSAMENNPDDKDIMLERCLKECEGYELVLCSFNNSCRLIEKMFADNRCASLQWMQKLINLDEESQLMYLLKGSACRTLETLIFALSNTLDAEILSNWVNLSLKHWDDVIFNKNASRFIRSLVRHIVGLPKTVAVKREGISEPKYIKTNIFERKKIPGFSCNSAMKDCFTKVADRAFDFEWMSASITHESASLFMQDLIECDYAAQCGYAQVIVRASLDHAQDVLEQWKGKQSSRVWEVLVQTVDEDTRQALFHATLDGHMLDLALHQYANFPLQKFMISAKSDELLTDICDEMIINVDKMCDAGKLCVIAVLIPICRKEQQEGLLQHLRHYFKSETETTETHFLPNVFTLNDTQVEIEHENGLMKFDVTKGKFHGSFLLQELVGMPQNESILRAFKALSPTTVVELASNQNGSYILQAVFKTPHVSLADKAAIGKPLKSEWQKILNEKTSSFVFDALWDNGVFELNEKESIMDLIATKNVIHLKMLHRVCARVNIEDFKENRKKWLEEEKGRMKKKKGVVDKLCA